MKKAYYAVFLGLFLALCLIFSVGLLVAGPAEAGANERLSDAPVLITEDGAVNLDYLSDLSDWVNDRFYLRQELISLDRLLTAKVFGTSGESGVILGKDGWLYFTDTLADYTGTDPLTQRELYSVAKNLALMAEYCQSESKEFAFVIAPNKNSLYDEFMPDYGAAAEIRDADRLMELLEEMGVNTVDLFAAFEKEEEILYFAHDSHWNSKGAALGADLINQAFGVSTDYYGGEFTVGEAHEGDLYAMMYPALIDPERDLTYCGTLDFTFTTKATKPDAIVLSTESGAEGSLLAYRDSFGNLLFPYLADSYAAAKFSRSTTYDLTGEADFVLVELVERNISYLITYVPVMASPVRQVELPENVLGAISTAVDTKGDFVRVSGEIPQIDDDSAVYVLCGQTAYEAFCMADNGFAVNLPEDCEAEYLVCTVDGAPTAYQLEK